VVSLGVVSLGVVAFGVVSEEPVLLVHAASETSISMHSAAAR
jgi:hypothetical protein